jgi:hypothetical protein
MSNETIGLTVKIDGDISSGKKKVDELAAYAKQMLGTLFRPGGVPGGGGGIPAIEKPIDEAKKRASAKLKAILKEIRDTERQIKSLGLADTMLGSSIKNERLRADYERLSATMQNLRQKTQGFYGSIDTGSKRGVAAMSQLYDNIARVERALSGVQTRFNRVDTPNRASRFLPPVLNNTDVLGTARAVQDQKAAMFAPLQSQVEAAKRLAQDVRIQAIGDGDSEALRNMKDRLAEIKSTGVGAINAIDRSVKGADKTIDAFTASIRSAGNELERLENKGKSQNFQKMGMFRNNAISPIFTAQQIVEDFSYAGMRGAANNIAFLLAELAPAGGLGMKLAGGGILALMTYQFYEMGKSMKWWGSQVDTAAQKASKLKATMEAAGSASLSVSSAMAGSQSSLISGGLSLPLGQSGQSFMELRNRAMMNVMRGPAGIRALRSSIEADPSRFPFGNVGQSLSNVPAIKEAQSRAARIQQAMNVTDLMKQNRPSSAPYGSTAVGWIMKNLMFLPDPTGGGNARAIGSQASGRDQIREMLMNLPGGSKNTAILDGMGAGNIDFSKITDQLKEMYTETKNEVASLQAKHETAMKEMKESSGAAAAEVLNIAQGNRNAADAVEGVIQANEELNASYKRQMDILKNIEVLRERDNFRSSAFALMRSKGSQFLEEAGAPRWLIEQRNRGLYERQAGFLYGSAQASGAAGDIRGQIDYLKQIQQLQFEVIGNTDNRNVAERVMERAIVLQHEIEALIRTNQQQGQAEYEMVQQLTGGLIQMREILNSMPKIQLGALQQAGEVAQLNAQLAVLRANGLVASQTGAGASQMANIASSAAVIGRIGAAPGFNKGGHIPGYGGGDKVPALLEKGEFVINKNAVRTLGVDTMHEINAAGNVRKFRDGGWSGTGYGMVYSTYPGQRERARRLRSGQAWSRDFRGESASAWARRGVLSIREQEEIARQSERSWMAMYGRAAGQIGNWGSYGDTGIEATLGAPGGIAAARARGGMFGGDIGSIPGISMKRVGIGGGQTSVSLGSENHLVNSGDLRQFFADRSRARIAEAGGTVMQRAPNGTFSWNGINHFSQRDFMAHMRQRNGGMLNVNWGETYNRGPGRNVNTQYGQVGGGGWMDMRMAQRQATAGLLSNRARQAQAAGAASRLRYTRQAYNLNAAGENRRAIGSFFASRNGMSPQQVAAMRRARFSGSRWGGNFSNYVGQLFGGGFSPYMMGGFGGYGMQVPQMARSYGLYDSGPALMGLRAFAKGGYVTKDGGRLISLNPDVYQDDTDWEFMGGYPSNGPDMNYMSFMDQRNRVLAGSYNRSDLGAMDFAGNQLGSFGQFSDGSYRSRYSGGFSSVGRGQGFSSGMGGRGFSSFGRPIGAMTGGFITQGAGIQRFATGGLVRGGTTTSSSSTVNNNFGTVRIEVKSPKDAADATTQMRRSKSSYWAQKG